MERIELPPKIQNQIMQFQQLQQQLQIVTGQKQQMEALLREIESTLAELSKLKEGAAVFRNVGSVLVKVENIEELKKELEEQKDVTSIRIKALEKQESQMRERYQSLQSEISRALKGVEVVSAS